MTEREVPAWIYEGTIRHRRVAPKRHDFRYRLFMALVDLDAVDAALDRLPRVLIRFRRDDYFGDPAVPLGEAVRREVERRSGVRPEGAIRMLTHLRQWGVGFNPVSFYYCLSPDGDGHEAEVEHIVAEVTNTPWGERHLYVLSEPTDARRDIATYEHAKDFHVSPFMPMDQRYRWRFTPPAERLLVHIDTLGGSGFGDASDDAKRFDATLDLRRRGPLTARALVGAQLRHPAMPAMVLWRIYRQAAALCLKRVPFHPHPDRFAERTADIPESS